MIRKHSAIIIIFSLSALIAVLFAVRLSGRGEDRRFEDYTAELFRREVSQNSITLHYTLKNPEDCGIKERAPSLGAFDTDSGEACAALENALALLRSFDRARLSKENRLTYDVLEHSFKTSLEEAKYLLYEEPLSPLTGVQSQLPVLLSEYHFYDVKDCETYLDLLRQVPEYLRSVADFERARADAGLFMSDARADDTIGECEAFLQMSADNYLYSSFEERLDTLGLSPEDRESYTARNRECIEACVFPAYQELISALRELRGTGNNACGLCYSPDGAAYYATHVAAETGTSRSIPELRMLALSHIAQDTAAIRELFSGGSSESNDDSGEELSHLLTADQSALDGMEPEAILSELKSRLPGSFPGLPDVDVQVKYVKESMEEYLSPAFYMIPPVDGTEENVIYINRGHLPDGLTLFTTLAHEGYPGHLYQTVYYAATDPDPIRSLLSCGGYVEGWATYCEMAGYYYAPISKEQASLMQHNSSVILGLYALADIGIHYDGWTLLDTVSFFRGYGITDTETIEEIYDLIVSDPGNYLKYYIGYVEFLELKKDAIKAWGNGFSQERFHKAVLDAGPVPFDILRNCVLGTGKD